MDGQGRVVDLLQRRLEGLREPTRRCRSLLFTGWAYDICPPRKGGASHDGFGVLVSTTFPSFQNHRFAHDLPHTSCVRIKVHLILGSRLPRSVPTPSEKRTGKHRSDVFFGRTALQMDPSGGLGRILMWRSCMGVS